LPISIGTNPGRDDRPGLLTERLVLGELRVLDRFARRGERELREAVHPPRVAPAEERVGVEPLDLGRDARRQL
jgi:hypothetical protein